MAKKPRKKPAAASRSTGSAVKLSPRDAKTLGDLVGLADRIVEDAIKSRDPYLDIPACATCTRTIALAPTSRRGSSKWGATRTAGSCSIRRRRKASMQTVLVASGCKQLLEQQKSTSIRGLYYLLKHTIDGTKEETFDSQDECDPVIEDLEVTLSSLREELHVYASNRGGLVGPFTLIVSGVEIDCARMGSGGYSIPSIVEPETIVFKKNEADFILHVEKDTVWRRFNEDKFWRKHNCNSHAWRRPAAAARALASPDAHRTESPGLLPAR